MFITIYILGVIVALNISLWLAVTKREFTGGTLLDRAVFIVGFSLFSWFMVQIYVIFLLLEWSEKK